MISCADCGNTDIDKTLMAPNVRSQRSAAADVQPPSKSHGRVHALAAPSTPAEQAMAELRRKIEANSEYVGTDFAQQARQMHEGDAPARSIYGEAESNEARQLDGGRRADPAPALSSGPQGQLTPSPNAHLPDRCGSGLTAKFHQDPEQGAS